MTTTGSHYTVLARRFRPQAFDEVVGQEHVARALRNAIRAGRVAHAYMFTGARGVGKTSTARILAKALNCPHVEDGVPCNQCEICQGISAGNDVDVLEIDGASNRGIDDIRSLRANVGVRSMRTQFKVYIIDEVHMLTREAFNALLKTLEEPPPNVKFVFCTTEPNKVPDTILSRCQRFDFSSIAETSIADRLRQIAKIEGYEVSEDALELVSRRARGSMRDSQSLFDQLLAFSDGTVAADDVHRMLGTAGDERLLELFRAIIEHRPGEVLSLLDSCFVAGVQPGELMDQAIGYVRDLMVTLSGGDSVSLCSIAPRYRSDLLAQGRSLGMQTVMAAFQILSDAKTQMFRSTFARTVLEMALVQLSLLENLSALSELLSGRLPAPAGLSEASASSDSAGEKKNSEPQPLNLPSSATPTELLERAPSASPRTTPTDDSASHPAPALPSPVPAADAVPTATGPEPSTVPLSLPVAASPEAPALELTVASAPSLLQKLISACGLTIASGLKMVREVQLTSPSRLELLIDSSAEFACRVLDLPDNRARMEQEILRLTGSAVAVGLRRIRVEPVAESVLGSESALPAPASGESPGGPSRGRSAKVSELPVSGSAGASVGARKPRPAALDAPVVNLTGEIDPSRDAFVQQVVEAFGATVVKVTSSPLSRAGEPAMEESAAV